jgi:hypothetical protein
MRRMHNGIARGVGPVAETLADIIEPAANTALAKIGTRRVKVSLRPGAIGIAGGKGQRQDKQAQAGWSHHKRFLSPLSSSVSGQNPI